MIRRQKIRAKEGGVSELYVEVKGAFSNPATLNYMADALWKLMSKETSCIASSGYGGIPLASTIASRHNRKLTLVRQQLKRHGKQTWIEGYVPKNTDNVSIVDDKIITGNSVREVIKVLEKANAKILGCYVVVLAGNPIIDVPLYYLAKEEELE
ncbi:hypothetical protein HY546_01305 [archaeon]|nr:hypothetical protein [archaeon]